MQAPTISDLEHAPVPDMYSLGVPSSGIRINESIWPALQDKADLALPNVFLLVDRGSDNPSGCFLWTDINADQNHISEDFDPVQITDQFGNSLLRVLR